MIEHIVWVIQVQEGVLIKVGVRGFVCDKMGGPKKKGSISEKNINLYVDNMSLKY